VTLERAEQVSGDPCHEALLLIAEPEFS